MQKILISSVYLIAATFLPNNCKLAASLQLLGRNFIKHFGDNFQKYIHVYMTKLQSTNFIHEEVLEDAQWLIVQSIVSPMRSLKDQFI